MAYDALTLSVLTKEIATALTGGKINRIYQPEKDEIVLTIFNKQTYRLLISANAGVNRIHLTDKTVDNPTVAPAFCMLLRKYLINAQINNIEQMPYERVLDFTLNNRNDLGYSKDMHLIFELTGKTSNIILTEENYTVLDSIKHLPTDMDSKRIILNGAKYPFFQPQDKLLPFDINRIKILLKTNLSPIRQLLVENLLGVSQTTVNEMTYGIDENDRDKAIDIVLKRIKEYEHKLLNPQPAVLYVNGSMKEVLPFEYDSKKGEYRHYDTLNGAHDEYYFLTDKYKRFADKAKSVNTIVKNAVARTEKKLAIQKQSILEAQESDYNKKAGDLILANIYLIKQGADKVVVQDYYEADCPQITIALDKALNAQQNAQKYYKKYRKQKSTIEHNTKLVEENEKLLQYLITVQQSLNFCSDASDLNEIVRELTDCGIIKEKRAQNAKKNSSTSKARNEIVTKPLKYVIDGYTVYVGKNNIQNNYVTFKLARANDLWLHTHDVHSSHAVVINDSNQPLPPDDVIVKAAEIVAYYSQARNGTKVSVDYTQKYNVKKPNKAALGFVTYNTYYTVVVNPNEHRQLLQQN